MLWNLCMIRYKCECAHLGGRWRLSDARWFACPGRWSLDDASNSHPRKSRACRRRLEGGGGVKSKAQADQAVSARTFGQLTPSNIMGWSGARIAFPSSTPNTSLFTVFVSWSSVSLKSDRMTWASRPWWALTQWAWLPRNFWITLISWLGSASRSCSYTRA